MTRFLARRFFQALMVLLVLAAVLYAVFYLAPGDAARLACGPKCSVAQVEQIRDRMGLNDPVYVQFWHFLAGIVAGHDYSTGTAAVHCPAPCLGQSYRTGDLVSHVVAVKLPATASLALGAMALWLVIGVGTGVVSALRRGTLTERLLTGFTLVGTAVPVFITGILLLLVFCSWLQWLPFPTYVPLTQDPQQWAWNLLLPWLALALVEAAKYARLTRSSMLETLAEDHIRTFRAYGVGEGAIVRRHALRAALTPVIALSALDLGTMFGGALLTETLFGIPGLGQQLVQSVQSKDLPVVVGIVLVMGLAVVAANAIADVLYAVSDRRVVLA
ncbi:peptide/nickel transport system permease protein [Streptomyces sp. DvalAA-14]|uniref:ABC transporter permease n=1 Tax=unclassified Streptomyces TaxID=2593676 RepID=UPI00081B5397|nr:ABC transporter permease [Streptomyces sp. DvalAA-14]MYS20515.1 ABC transporter permease subunit [Streptomyces sp. SID4948]SCD70845.1 peptide/nickel transport system permease protein [Streptomyces sp. DvalAA-14]